MLHIPTIYLTFIYQPYQLFLITTVYALENMMTCRVHRAVILGLISNGERQTTTAFGFTTAISRVSATNDETVQEYILNTKNTREHQKEQVDSTFHRIYSIGEGHESGRSTT